MTDNPHEIVDKLETIDEWSAGGTAAFNLAQDGLAGEEVPNTEKNRAITISAAVRMFFDGLITDPKIKEIMKANKLDMNNLRSSLVEQTLVRALPQIINSGDIERLAKLGMLGGEKIDPGAAGNAVCTRYISAAEDAATDEHIKTIIGDISPDED